MRGIANDDTATYELVSVEDYVDSSVFERVEFYWARHAGVRYTSSTPGKKSVVRDCVFHDINTPGLMDGLDGGAVLGGVPEITVEGCRFNNIGDISTFHAVYLSGPLTDVVVTGCQFSSEHARLHIYQAYTAENVNVSVTGNTFDGVQKSVINNASNAVVAGNAFRNSSLNPSADGICIVGNSFYQNDGAKPIYFINPSIPGTGCKVTGNTFTVDSAASPAINYSAISLSWGNRWTISDNTFTCPSALALLGTRRTVVERNRFTSNAAAPVVYVLKTTLADGATSGTPITTLTSASAPFNAEDVGLQVVVTGAGPGGSDLVSKIASYQSATQVTLATAASAALTNRSFYICRGAVFRDNVFEITKTTGSAEAIRNDIYDTLAVGNRFLSAGATFATSTAPIWHDYLIEKGLTAVRQLTGSASWTPTASLADGAVSSTTITVTGAVVGDVALASLSSIGTKNVLLTAHVEDDDDVRVVLMNKTGSNLTLGAGTVKVEVWKH
jgi:hypothetical protein